MTITFLLKIAVLHFYAIASSVFYKDILFPIGTFRNAGGAGGSQAENGGPGTVYVHKLPVLDSSGQVPSTFVQNRTLWVDNEGKGPKDPLRNLTTYYSDITRGSAVAWLIPSEYPSFVPDTITRSQVMLDEFQIYSQAQMAIVNPDYPTAYVYVNIYTIDGDRSGHLHIGFNQSLFVGNGRVPNDLSVYHGGDTTLQGELRVAGVDIMIEGVLKNVENLTVVDGGRS